MALSIKEVRKLNKSLLPQGLRYCNSCGTTKELSQFTQMGEGRTRPRCRSCGNSSSSSYRSGGRDPRKPWPLGGIGYKHAHRRAEAVWGAAKDHLCSEGCGKQAEEWAYNHQDPDEYSVEKVDGRKGDVRVVFYSGHHDFYQAMCRACHIRFDVTARQDRASRPAES